MPKLPFAAKPQFSLRLMLVVLTVLCIVLGVWIVPRERKLRAVKAISKLGGYAIYFEPDKVRPWLPKVYFDDVKQVLLCDTQVTDDMLALLEPLRKVQWLDLDNSRITDAGLVHLERMTDLKVLSLMGTQVGDAGLAHLQGLSRLQVLYLDRTQVGDAGLIHLHRLTNLQQLWLSDTKVTDEGIPPFQKALPECEIWINGERFEPKALAH
jgi:hypothetical protein